MKLIAVLSFVFFIPTINVFADSNLNYSVSVEPALNITTSSSKVSLNLNPLTHDFDSQNLNISISTNNLYGYKLYVNASNTNLIEKNDSNLYIRTLDGEVSENDFKTSDSTLNRWGYRVNSTNNSNNNYLPFTINNTLLNYKYTAIEEDLTNLTFAAKVDYETKAGTYDLALNFQTTANPNIRYIQNFTNEDCKILASDNSYTVYDLRDENDYKVRYINGNCWMVQNLRFSSSELKKETTNINADKTISWGSLTTGDVYDVARYYNSGNVTQGYFYNYAGASAMTITGSANTNTQQYDICPNGWHLPTEANIASVTSYRSLFSPVAGGFFYQGRALAADQGYYWGSYNPISDSSPFIYYHSGNGSFFRDYLNRCRGIFVRCIRSS